MLGHRKLNNDGQTAVSISPYVLLPSPQELTDNPAPKVMSSANTRRHFKEKQTNRSLLPALMELWIPLDIHSIECKGVVESRILTS